jgi:putative tricarboxylic transport membrane protein
VRPGAGADLAVGVFVLAVAGLAFWQAAAIPTSPIYAQVGPKFIPYGVAAFIALCGAGLVLAALRGGWSADLTEVREAPPTNWRALTLLGAGLVANLALIDWLGFVFASTIMYVLVCAAFGSKRPLMDLGIGLAVTLAAYLGFEKGLGVNIGAGLLEGIL